MNPIFENDWFKLFAVAANPFGFIAIRYQKKQDKQYGSCGPFYWQGNTIEIGYYLVHATNSLYPVTENADGSFGGQFIFLA